MKMSEEIRKAIEKANHKFGDAVRNQDPIALAALYTEDTCLLPPNSTMIRGRQATQEFWGTVMKQMGLKDAILTTVELSSIGDTVNEIGNYHLKLQPEGQDLIEDKGKYIVHWKKTPDGWKLHWDIWNTSLPPPE